MRGLIAAFILGAVLLQCINKGPERAQKIVDKSIRAHGGNYFINSRVKFDFRDRSYTMTKNSDGYTYTRSYIADGDTIKDILKNSTAFKRYTNNHLVDVPDTMQIKYSNSVNSVLYFVQIPIILNDPAVVKNYAGEVKIKSENYHAIKVTFKTHGGGKDFEDEYMYWINTDTYKVDYLAYNYLTDGGGVRFREAYNRIERGNILFQDYVNYKAEIGTSLDDLPQLLVNGELKELSRIENKNIVVNPL